MQWLATTESLIAILLGLATIVAAIYKLYKKDKTLSPDIDAPTIVSRFIEVFENHGVHRNQIPRFFGHGLTLADVQDDNKLLSKLTEDMLYSVCKKFAIRREWLDGAEAQIYTFHDFYKKPSKALEFIESLKADNPDDELIGVLIAPEESKYRAEAIVIIQETIGYVGDKSIYRYHLCNNWLFSYWKPRAYLAAFVAMAWKNNIYIHGIYKPKEFIDELASGEKLLGWQGDDIYIFGHIDWYPEDMALDPDIYLNGVDKESNNHGLVAGLQLWLKLHDLGYMDTEFEDARNKFEAELNRIKL